MGETGKRWYIGIDFGTSNTCVVAYEATEMKSYTGDLAKGLSNSYLNIPTVITMEKVYVEEKKYVDKKYVGEETQKHPCLRVFKDLKSVARELTPPNASFGEKKPCEYPFEHCELNTELQFGNNDLIYKTTVRELIVEFLRRVLHVKDKDFEINKETLQKIVIGCPAPRTVRDGTRESYKETLKDIIVDCFRVEEDQKANFKNKIEVKEEPELAGITYLYSEEKIYDKNVLVIDIGGGTTDFSVLEYKNGKLNVENIGSCELAGNAIDDVIFNLLPENVIRSKAACRRCKENLFQKEVKDSSGYIISPKGMDELSYAWQFATYDNELFVHYDKKPTPNCIVLTTGELYTDDKLLKESKSISEVFKEIGASLRTALDNKKMTGINTILFAGGTSIITPLREELIGVVVGGKYCTADFNKETDVVTMFGDDTRTLCVDKSKVNNISCYNAVAFGALIKAMGDNVKLKPHIIGKLFDSSMEFTTTKNDLLMVSDKSEVPCRRTFCKRNRINYYINTKAGEDFIFCFEIDAKTLLEYKIELSELKNDYSIAIIAKYKNGKIKFDAYYYNGDVPEDYEEIEKLQLIKWEEIENKGD